MTKSRQFVSFLPLFAIIFAISGVVAPAFAAPEKLTIALSGDFTSLDPSKDSTPLGFNYHLNVFDQLTEIHRDGSAAPRLATDWTISDDLTDWTFHIRQDVKFHDGSPLTAGDVVWTVQHILDDETSPVRTFIKLVASVDMVDDYTVHFKLTQPYSIFERQISFVNIMPQKYFEQVGEQAYAAKPVGSGPYKMVEWVKDDRMVLEANPDYWGGAPAIKTATFRPIPSEASRAAALMSGEIDVVPTLPPALLEQLRTSPDVEVGTAPGSRVVFVAFNVNVPPLNDPKVREAIDKAIDRKSLTDDLLRGLGKPTGIMVPPVDIGYDASILPTEYDPEAARKLVADSSYNGEVISIQYPSNNIVMANETVQAIAGYMTAVGLKVEIKPMEFTAFFPLWLQTKMESMYMFAYGSSQYHADTILTSMYEAGSRIYKVNPEIDRLVKEQRTKTNLEERLALISKAFRLSNEDRYELPLYDEMHAFGTKAGLDYKPWPDGFVRLYDIK